MRRKGFTLVELIIAIMIMGVLAGMMTLSPKSARQTAKKEAEKVKAFLESLTQRADRMKGSFDITIENDTLSTKWHVPDTDRFHTSLKASTGYSYALYKGDGSTITNFNYSVLKYPNSAIISIDKDKTGTLNFGIVLKETEKASYYVAVSGDNLSKK